MDKTEKQPPAAPKDLDNLRHELRTPLNIIMGCCEVLLDDAKKRNHKFLILALEEIRQAGNRLIAGVKEILASGDAGLGPMGSDKTIFQFGLQADIFQPIERLIHSSRALRATAEKMHLDDFVRDLSNILGAAEQFRTLALDGMIYTAAETDSEDSKKESAADSATKTNTHAAADEPAVPDNTMLVVDANETNRELLQRHLQQQGYQVMTAPDGHQALDMLSKYSFDLIFLAVKLPQLSGIEVLQKLKKRYVWRHIPVIMISALDDVASIASSIEMGAEDYLPKHFNPSLLKARISACLEKKRWREKELTYLVQIKDILKQLNAELAQAAEYVKNLLPTAISQGPVKTAWRFIPSASLGGDALGYYWLDDDNFVIFLLDVSGHGVGAALYSVSVMNALRSQNLPGADFHEPARVLEALNNSFPMESQQDMYFTIWYGVYNRSSRNLVYASSGHPPALLSDNASGKDGLVELRTRNTLLGYMPDVAYHQAELTIGPASRLFVYSDGVYEISLEKGQRWAFWDYTAFMRTAIASGASCMDLLFDHVRDLNAKETLEDDFSILELTFE